MTLFFSFYAPAVKVIESHSYNFCDRDVNRSNLIKDKITKKLKSPPRPNSYGIIQFPAYQQNINVIIVEKEEDLKCKWKTLANAQTQVKKTCANGE